MAPCSVAEVSMPRTEVFRSSSVAAKVRGILVAELNYGQIVHEVERAVAGACPVELCAKYNMEIFEPEEIEKGIDGLVAGGNK